MAEEIYDWAIRENCQILLKGAPGYPELLQEIFDPPLILYCSRPAGNSATIGHCHR